MYNKINLISIIHLNLKKRNPLKMNNTKNLFNFIGEIPSKINDTKKFNSNNPLKFYIGNLYKIGRQKNNPVQLYWTNPFENW